MSIPITESELIINERGAIYHLNIRPEELADTVLLVGDPKRVELISKYFTIIESKQEHREFISHTGYYGKKRITVLSTGIGTDNIDIAINELDAIANIDFKTRIIKMQLKRLDIIRIGTSGGLQKDIDVGSFVSSTHGLGIDNLLHYYVDKNNDEEQQIIQHFLQHTQLNATALTPYIASASMHLQKYFVNNFHQGITITCPGFYGPQGRILRLPLAHPQLNTMLTSFQFGNRRITNFEMETSAIYSLGKLLGHRCLSLNAIVANRVTQTFSKHPTTEMDKLICMVLKIVETI